MKITIALLVAAVIGTTAGCNAPQTPPDGSPSLKQAFEDDFLVGAALNPGQFTGSNAAEAELVAAQFNTITPENVLKWESVHPAPDSFAFDAADRYVAFGEAHDMFIVGHTLVWHSQTPRWVFQNDEGEPRTRDELLALMEDHITTVVGRYRGRVDGWDVVNEALNEDGSLRDSPWRRIIGDDFIEKAFQFANAADPDAELYYNDYSLANGPKAAGAVALVERLRGAGLRVDGIGAQGHWKMDWPSPTRLDSAIVTLSSSGVPVMITELDIDLLPQRSRNRGADVGMTQQAAAGLNPYTGGLPDSMQTALADRYAALFGVLVRHADVVDRVTFWGVQDGASWLNNWPIPGRTSYPLLFGRDLQPKPAYDAVMATAGR